MGPDLRHTAAPTIRLAEPDDYDALGELTVDAYRSAGFLSADSDYADELRDATARARSASLLAAALPDGSLAGTATLITERSSPFAELCGEGEAELRMLAVDPGVQRGGIGRALVEACIDRARSAGCHRMVLSSRPDMHAAHRLYERLGFRRTPQLDWEPMPGFRLMGYSLDLSSAGAHPSP